MLSSRVTFVAMGACLAPRQGRARSQTRPRSSQPPPDHEVIRYLCRSTHCHRVGSSASACSVSGPRRDVEYRGGAT